MRRDGGDLIREAHYAVEIIFREEGLVLEMIDVRLVWCEAHCVDDYAANFTSLGFRMLFVNPNDALAFKLRWY